MKIKFFISLPMFLVLTGFSYGSSESNFDISTCLNVAGGEHPAMMDCYGQKIDFISKGISEKLTTEYGDKVLVKVAELLRNNQSNWEVYAKSLCAVYLEMGGQRGVLLQASCLENKYQERLKELTVILEQAEL